MVTREEAKERMSADWCSFFSVQDSLDALLSQDQVKIDEINASRARCAAYNAQMELDIDLATDLQFEEMVRTFTPYKDIG